MKAPTDREIKIANDFINSIKALGFNSETSQYDSFINWERLNKETLKENHIVCGSGETKICFILESLTDWVIKVSFSDIEDACEIEYDNYCSARTYGLERFFAATYILSNHFYIQERAKVSEVEFSSKFDTDEYEFWELEDDDRIRKVLGDGEDVDKLVAFCGNAGINDLHDMNWGKTDRGYVMIDFSGYHDF